MAVKLKKRNVLVLGGSGFLGSHVADTLTHEGFSVTIYDRVKSPYLQPRQKMILGDIRDAAKLELAIKNSHYVFNFAGVSNLDDAKTKPMDTIQLNIAANAHILSACVRYKISRYIYASTIYVYSDKGGFYRCSKQAAELYIEEYHRRFGLDFTILRYGTLYGPRADDRNSIHKYLKEVLQKGTMTCAGSIDGVRDYVHVRDAAQMSVDVLEPKYNNQHVIISGLHPIRFREMIKILEEIVGSKIAVKVLREKSPAHYMYTPYSFVPKIGKKLTTTSYIDIGQGLLECLSEINHKVSE